MLPFIPICEECPSQQSKPPTSLPSLPAANQYAVVSCYHRVSTAPPPPLLLPPLPSLGGSYMPPTTLPLSTDTRLCHHTSPPHIFFIPFPPLLPLLPLLSSSLLTAISQAAPPPFPSAVLDTPFFLLWRMLEALSEIIRGTRPRFAKFGSVGGFCWCAGMLFLSYWRFLVLLCLFAGGIHCCFIVHGLFHLLTPYP